MPFALSPTPWLARSLVALALGVTGACAVDRPTSDVDDSTADLRALIGDAACNSDAQCGTIGIGAKACGGPSAYWPWSSLRTDAKAIEAAAARQTEARRNEIIARGAVSNCAVVPDPGAYCAPVASTASGVTGVCRLRAGGATGARTY